MCVLACLLACEKSGDDRAEPTQPVLRPKNPPPPTETVTADAAPTGCPTLVVAVKPDGVWIRNAKSQAVVPLCVGEIDRAALAARLCALTGAWPPDCTAVEVAADTGVKYQQVINVMEAAMMVGLTDVGMVEMAALSLPLQLPPDPSDRVAPQCTQEVAGCPVRRAASRPRDPLPVPPVGVPSAPGTVADAIVIVIPADGSITVNGKKLATARQASAGERIEPLYKELEAAANPDGSRAVILQVDRDTDARVVNRVIATAKAAGYDNVLFAVRNKNPSPDQP
jgi:biopolymer transport protein ExbD